MWDSWNNSRILDLTDTADDQLVRGDISFFINNGVVQFQRFESSPIYYHRLLEICSPLAAVIGKKASMFANGKIEFNNANTGSEVRGLNKAWPSLLKRPNIMQTGREFLHQLYTFMALRGFVYAYPMYAEGFDEVPESIWLLPPWHVLITPMNGDFFSYANGTIGREIIFNWRGNTTRFDESELILFKDPGAIDVNELTWLPESRVRAVSRPIATLVAEVESRYTIVTKRGAHGIITNNTGKGDVNYVPLKPDEMEDLQRNYAEYGTMRHQKRLIITQANLDYKKIGDTIKDLQLFEEHQRDIMDICDVYGLPYELMSNAKGQTYANINEAKKSAYQDTIIPEATSITEQLEIGLKLNEKNIEMSMSYETVEALQESMRDTGTGRLAMNNALAVQWENNLITLNDWREQLGDDLVPGEPNDFYKYEFDQWMKDKGYEQPVILQIPGNEQPQKQPANAA